MSSRKILTGWVLIALGAIGLVACLAGAASVWLIGSHLQRANSEVFRQANELVAQIDRRTAEAGEAVGGTRDLVDALKQMLRDSAAELAAERLAALPEVDKLERRLASAMERADGLVQVSASTAELIERLLATISVIVSERNVDLKGASELTATIRATRESLINAGERLADVQRCLDEVRQKRDVDVNLSQITKLSLGIVAKLDIAKEQLSVFRGRLAETKKWLDQSQARIRGWIFAGQGLIMLLMIWIGAGQYCLVLQGRRILGSPPSNSG